LFALYNLTPALIGATIISLFPAWKNPASVLAATPTFSVSTLSL